MQASIAERPAVLTSWKEIARYMGKGVRTVQRWEQEFGLPVRRPLGSDKKAVLARPSDLDSWVALRCGIRSNPCSKADLSSGMMAIRTNVAAQLETSRQLRKNNLQVRREIGSLISAVSEQIAILYKQAS